MQQYNLSNIPNVVPPHLHLPKALIQLSPQVLPKMQYNLLSFKNNFQGSSWFHRFILLFMSQFVAKWCSSSFGGETMPLIVWMNKIVKTNFEPTTILPNIIFGTYDNGKWSWHIEGFSTSNWRFGQNVLNNLCRNQTNDPKKCKSPLHLDYTRMGPGARCVLAGSGTRCSRVWYKVFQGLVQGAPESGTWGNIWGPWGVH